MDPRTLTVRLLGRFEVDVDGRTVPDEAWRHRRAAAVVKMLALAPRHRLMRDQVIESLWPDLPPEAGAANLRKAAHRARRAMGVDEGVVLRRGTVELAPDAVIATDVVRFASVADDALRRADVKGCRDAAALYTGELLPDDRYETWCADRREQLRMRHLAVLSGGQLWGRVLELDPADERAHREIVRGHLEAGDRRAAIRQFDRMRAALRDELGVSPDPDSIALYEQVLAMEGRDDVPTPAERARALLAWGVVHWERSDLEEAEKAAVEARALAIDAGLGREVADASELLGLVAYAQGRWREVFGQEFVEAVRHTPELTSFVFDAHMCMSEFALGESDGVQAMTEFAEEVLAAAEETSMQARALGLLLRGEAALLAGEEPTRARADLVEAARLHEETASSTGWALATERLAQSEAVRGRDETARRLHREALELAKDSPVPNHLLLFVYGGMLEVPDSDAARIVREGEAAAAGQRMCDPCSMPFRVGASMVTARAGELDRAREHFAEAERVAMMWRGGPWHAAVAEARATLRFAEGAREEEVSALLREAAAGFTAGDRPRDAARCRATIATLR